MVTSNSGTAKLRPRARLISLIGEELISDEPVALVELVKNSYDADATFAEVRFEGGDLDHPTRIVVTDDGIGMDIHTVLNAWLEPGTSMKRRTNKSPKGRLFQGAKGIGRFAAARLAESLILETKSDHSQDEVIVVLDWGSFDEDSYLEDIDIEYETVNSSRKSGTRLTMEGVRTRWEETDYESLYDRLSRLISPFEEVLDFEVKLEIPGYPHYSGRVQPPDIILNPRYMLRGELDDEGFFSGEFIFDGSTRRVWGEEWWENKQDLSPKIVESLQIEEKLKLGGRKKPISGGFGVEIRAWDRDREGLDPYVTRYSRGIQEIRRILNRYSGVSVYRDGFRVYPYGQTGNDWLNLDNRSRQSPTRRLANNQTVGAIRISREQNPDLIDRSNREGMVLNNAHVALEDWFKEVLSVLEEERYKLRPRAKEIGQDADPLFEVFDLTATVESAKNSFGQEHPFIAELTRTAYEINEGVERVQEVFSRLLMSAGLGHMVDVVIHEIGRPLGSINRRVISIQKLTEELCSETDGIDQHLLAIKGAAEDIHNLRERLDPQTPAKRGRAEIFDVFQEIEDNFALYEALIQRQKIDYRIHPESTELRVKMARSSLGQILANLIDNSIYWIMRQNGTGNGGTIHVVVEETDQGFRILFSDDGPGVDPEYQKDIFEPYVTRKPNGIGLGLYIARLIIEPYGKITYRDDCDLPGACFEVLFEKGVGR